MRIPSGTTDQVIYFVAVDSADFVTREAGLSSFTVYRDRNGGGAAAMTTPTVTEVDSSNMPGVYKLLLDEDMTIGAGNDSEEMAFHITHAGMAPVTRTIELYRPKITAGNTLDVTATGAAGIDWGNVENKTTANDLTNTKTLWNANWDAEVQSEVQDALEVNNLDHLCKTATGGADMTTEVADNTIISRIIANGDTSAFVPSTDGLQLIRDALTALNDLSLAEVVNALIGGNTFYVSKSGDDGNGGTSWADAKLTITSAISVLSNGDSLWFGPGTYTENVDASSLTGITFEASGWGTILTSDSGYTLKIGSQTRLNNIQITSTATETSAAVWLSGKADCRISRCLISGTYDGVFATSTTNLCINNSIIKGTYDAINLASATDFLLSDSTFYTDCTWDSGGTFDRPIVCQSSRGTVENCNLIALRDDTTSQATMGICLCESDVQVNDCLIIAKQAGNGTGRVVGVGGRDSGFYTAEGTSGNVSVNGGQVITSQAGSGYEYSVHRESGTLSVSAAQYDTTKTSGTITIVPSNVGEVGGSAQSATNLKDFADTGYDPGTHKVAGVALVDTTTSLTNKTDFSLAADQSGVTIGTVSTLTGHTAQTGDNYARLGAPAGASVSADIAAIEGGATAEEVDTQLSSTHGAGEWSVSGGEGAYTGTLTVDDGEGTGLEGAVVHARRGGVLKASGTTDSSGEITDWVFGAYTYNLAVRLAGYQPEADTITVSGDAWSKTISMTAISITAPDDATLCTVQFRVKLSAAAVSGAVCKARLLGTNQASDGTILSNAESSDTTDSEGVADLQLVQKGSIVKGNGLYKIWVEIAGQPVASVETTIPNQSTYLFEDLLGA
jgi:hypothetical protein